MGMGNFHTSAFNFPVNSLLFTEHIFLGSVTVLFISQIGSIIN